MKNNVTVYGIDHGFGLTKTAHTELISGVKVFGKEEPPLPDRTVCLDGNYYVCGGKRMNVMSDKTANENYYILTLAAIASEMKLKKKTKDNVIIAAGLPIERMGIEKEKFKQYLLKNKEVKFAYEGLDYQIQIEEVQIYPQGYAAVVSRIGTLLGTHILVDIGSWTIDILPIIDKVPDTSRCSSLNMGVITCMTSINNEMRRKFNIELEETQIQDIMRGGTGQLPKKYLEVVRTCIIHYTEEIFSKLREIGFNLEVTPVIFIGGGAAVMKKYGKYDGEMTTIILDIHANSSGYEFIAKQKIQR